jgi:hypothetical protein
MHDFLRAFWLFCYVYIILVEIASVSLVVTGSGIVEFNSHLSRPYCRRYIPPPLLTVILYPVSESTTLLVDYLPLLLLLSEIVCLLPSAMRQYIFLSFPLACCSL